MPSRLIENLRLLDSHERGLLLQWTADEPFRLGEPIRAEVARLTGSRPAPDAFIAMDYTLDWLYAAVQRTVAADEAWPRPWPDSDELAASQEDVDLLIAWDDQAGTHLTLIEAKGFTGWSNRVMSRKTDRIEAIFHRRSASSSTSTLCLRDPRRVRPQCAGVADMDAPGGPRTLPQHHAPE